jgi:hypothetical protein
VCVVPGLGLGCVGGLELLLVVGRAHKHDRAPVNLSRSETAQRCWSPDCRVICTPGSSILLGVGPLPMGAKIRVLALTVATASKRLASRVSRLMLLSLARSECGTAMPARSGAIVGFGEWSPAMMESTRLGL